jgi:tol-pal system protein YbgF
MMHRSSLLGCATLAALSLLLAGTALAQEQRSSPSFLDNLFSRGDPPSPPRQSAQPQAQPQGQLQGQPRDVAQADPSDMALRLDRLEGALRQLTGTIEQLQYQNQQMQSQIQRMQSGAVAPVTAPVTAPGATPNVGTGVPGALQAPRPGNRSDMFDPSQHPNAPGAPRALGNSAVIAAPETAGNAPALGAPGGRDVGAPLDLSTLSGNPQAPQPAVQTAPQPAAMASAPAQTMQPPVQSAPAPARPAGNQLATLPPTASPQDEYDMAYGYVLHKDYALAEQAFRDFLRKYPDERLVPDAQYWLGESLFQRQRYRDAAESFLAVSTKYEKAGKAPDSLLRLGQSLAALNQKEAACATLAEVGRKFPRASASVKRGVTQEVKRAHC